jgi:4-hydroxy-tetrahydrodipicolinate synthase
MAGPIPTPYTGVGAGRLADSIRSRVEWRADPVGTPIVSGLRTDGLRHRLIAAVPVPFRGDGAIHAEAQARYVGHVAAQPIGGVAVWAHTGRGLHLAAEQRSEVLASWRGGLRGDQCVIAAAGAPRAERDPERVVRAAVAMARQAADLGADAVLVHPPTALRGLPDRDERIVRYHAAIAEAGLPLILFYLYEAAGGIAYSAEVLGRLLARPEVLGIKVATLDSVMTFQDVAGLIRARHPDKVLITGEDRFLGYSLMCGAEAALIGMAAACIRLQAEFLESYWKGNLPRFLALNGTIDDLAQHTFVPPMEGYILRMLRCLVREGVIPPESAHDPWGPALDARDARDLDECLDRVIGPQAADKDGRG